MREGRRGRTLPGHGSKRDIRFGATKVEKLATNMGLLCLLYLVTSLAACCLSNCLIAKEGGGALGVNWLHCSGLRLAVISGTGAGAGRVKWDLKVNSHLDFELLARGKGEGRVAIGIGQSLRVCVCVSVCLCMSPSLGQGCGQVLLHKLTWPNTISQLFCT